VRRERVRRHVPPLRPRSCSTSASRSPTSTRATRSASPTR
jgi:hypothetical protein